MPDTAVLDACVLVPIALCDVLLELADAQLFKPLWSETILAETRRTLVRKRGLPVERAERRLAHMRTAQPDALVTGFEHLITAMTNDPKDRHVLAAAVRARSKMIVTENLADFPPESVTPHGISVITADVFLCPPPRPGGGHCLERHRAETRVLQEASSNDGRVLRPALLDRCPRLQLPAARD
ncbi:MAG: PIN domain-containing protein [Bifidobacteriaceae bacterium]|jgi:predicted nucleic acid-binding protein|nr:PIN domain-containing protein [Bifidobacteriaceae bacterium]